VALPSRMIAVTGSFWPATADQASHTPAGAEPEHRH
jgi:hypothetical protein